VVAVLTEDADALADRAAALRELADRADESAPAAPNPLALLSADDDHRQLENRLLALSRVLEEAHPRALARPTTSSARSGGCAATRRGRDGLCPGPAAADRTAAR
jgi:hypothetical protein